MESNFKKHGLFMLGVTICFAVAGLSIFVEKIIFFKLKNRPDIFKQFQFDN